MLTSIGSAQRLGGALAQSDILALARLSDLVQRLDTDFDGDFGVDTMEVVQVGSAAQSLDRLVDGFADVVRVVGDPLALLLLKVKLDRQRGR
jgi:hypothetical protein